MCVSVCTPSYTPFFSSKATQRPATQLYHLLKHNLRQAFMYNFFVLKFQHTFICGVASYIDEQDSICGMLNVHSGVAWGVTFVLVGMFLPASPCWPWKKCNGYMLFKENDEYKPLRKIQVIKNITTRFWYFKVLLVWWSFYWLQLS